LRTNVAARILVLLLGCGGVAWGAMAFPTFKRGAGLDDVAARIIRGYAFQPQTLRDEIPALQALEAAPDCEAKALRSDAVIRLRIAENAFATADIAHLDEDTAALRTTIAKALSCSPIDSYLWLSLFRVNSISEGFRPSDLELLRMSYEEGPREGWIMGIRNHMALAIYSALPPDLAEHALAEFVALLQPEYVAMAVANFVGPGWPIRDVLLERMKSAPEAERSVFARQVAEKGYDVDVPGIVRPKVPGH
jgi:hypothetical protein